MDDPLCKRAVFLEKENILCTACPFFESEYFFKVYSHKFIWILKIFWLLKPVIFVSGDYMLFCTMFLPEGNSERVSFCRCEWR